MNAASRSFLLVFTLALAGPLARASTIVVDDNGGPGVQFTDIQPAVTAALPGDLIVVMPGSYSAFVLDKGLTLLASSGAIVSGTIGIQNVSSVKAMISEIGRASCRERVYVLV